MPTIEGVNEQGCVVRPTPDASAYVRIRGMGYTVRGALALMGLPQAADDVARHLGCAVEDGLPDGVELRYWVSSETNERIVEMRRSGPYERVFATPA